VLLIIVYCVRITLTHRICVYVLNITVSLGMKKSYHLCVYLILTLLLLHNSHINTVTYLSGINHNIYTLSNSETCLRLTPIYIYGYLIFFVYENIVFHIRKTSFSQ
jgi:hypothetical protein